MTLSTEDPLQIMSDGKASRPRLVPTSDRGRKRRQPLDLALDPAPELHHLTDLGNAARLAERHGSDLRWVEGRGWLKWNGIIWVVDPLEGCRCQFETMRYYRKKFRNEFGYWLVDKSEERARINASVELAKAFVAVDVGALDGDRWLLNVRNGTLDLHTGELRPHRAEDLITRLTDVDHDEEATCPTFLAFLARIFGDDEDLIAYVQRALGYTIIGGTSEQVLFICEGTGSNGKSTLLELVQDILGSYARAIPTSTLLHTPGHNPRYEMADLPGIRFVTAVESDVDKQLAEGLVKSLTGSDTIAARAIYKAPFTFKPQFTLWLATNHLPRIDGTDHAIWRRLKVIPFHVTIADDEQDKDLPLKLRAEAPGVLAWLIAGCRAYQAEGLGEPAAVTEAVAAFRESQDLVGQWLADCADLVKGTWTSSRRLVESFDAWAEANAMENISGVALGRKLADRGLQNGKRQGQRGWRGIRVATGVKSAADDGTDA